MVQIVLTASKYQHAFLSVHRKIFQSHVTRGNNLDPKYTEKRFGGKRNTCHHPPFFLETASLSRGSSYGFCCYFAKVKQNSKHVRRSQNSQLMLTTYGLS